MLTRTTCLLALLLSACADATFSVAEPLAEDPNEDSAPSDTLRFSPESDARAETLWSETGPSFDAPRSDASSADSDDDPSIDTSRSDTDSGDDSTASYAHRAPTGLDYTDTTIAAGTPGDFSTYPQALVDNSVAHVKASAAPGDWTGGTIGCPGVSVPCTTTIEKPYGGVPWTSITWCRDGRALVLPANAAPGCPDGSSPTWW